MVPRPMDHLDGATLDWLLAGGAAVRRLTLIHLIGVSPESATAVSLAAELPSDPLVAPLLADQMRPGVAGPVPVHPYKKWGGAHWRLLDLAELGVDIDTLGVAPAIEAALVATTAWLGSPARLRRARPIDGRARICGSQEGHALWAACHVGLGEDPRVADLAARLVSWQWPDGGWNCDPRPGVTHASFNETWAPARGLAAYARLGADSSLRSRAAAAAERAAEFILRHHVILGERSRTVAADSFGRIHWPPYWHYDLLAGLRSLAEIGPHHLGDDRTTGALDRLLDLRGTDGRWSASERWWHRPDAHGANVEVVAWGPEGERRMLTLQAGEVLSVAGRLAVTSPAAPVAAARA
jgi:hypothetical protein